MTTINDGESGASVRAKLNAALAVTDRITVTQPVDLDAVAARVTGLDAAVVLKGTWDAATGVFPGGGAAQAGESWIVSGAGNVDGVDFSGNDRIIAIADNASAVTFAANWHKADYTDSVTSVVGLTGTIAKANLLAALNVEDGAEVNPTGAEIVAAIDVQLGGTAWQGGGGAAGITYHNGTGGTLAKGTPIALGAFDTGSGNPGMVVADADGTGTMPCLGILGADVAAGASGIPVITGGKVTGLDTSAWALGDRLYVSTSGTLTNVRPTAGFIQPVAMVSRVDATIGEIIVAIEEVQQTIASLPEDTTIDGTEILPTGSDEHITTAALARYARRVEYQADGNVARTLAAGDDGILTGMTNATAATVTIPLDASVALPVGFTAHISRDTAGTVTITIPSGGTLNGVDGGSTTVSTPWRGIVTLHKIGPDAWALRGDAAGVA